MIEHIMKRNKIAWLLLGAALVAGCAQERTTSTNDDNKAFLEAWLKARYPGVSATGIGIYILEDEPGTGAAFDDEDYIYAEYTIRDINGNISSTTDRRTAQQIGSYNVSSYYGPTVIHSGEKVLQAGVEAMLQGMKTGGTRTALIPNWLLTYSRYSSADQYLKKSSAGNNVNTIYTLTLKEIIEDEAEWELDSLKRWLGVHAPDAVEVKDEEGLFYAQIVEPEDTTSFPKDTTIYINYIGRLLNGQVFDTTIKDTAKVHNIYNSSNNYQPVSIKWSDKATSITMGSGSSTVIEGFSKTLWQMRAFEKGVGYFVSSMGYGASGSGGSIPAYSPLIFEIEIVDSPESPLL